MGAHCPRIVIADDPHLGTGVQGWGVVSDDHALNDSVSRLIRT
jgi:hypothetical protein